jgi:hypothetical protein
LYLNTTIILLRQFPMLSFFDQNIKTLFSLWSSTISPIPGKRMSMARTVFPSRLNACFDICWIIK